MAELNQITLVDELNLEEEQDVIRGRREVPGGFEIIETKLPAVVSVKTACNEPRFLDYKIIERFYEEERVTVWGKNDLNLEEGNIGLEGSPTIVSGLAQAPTQERKREYLTGGSEQLVRQLHSIVEPFLRKSSI